MPVVTWSQLRPAVDRWPAAWRLLEVIPDHRRHYCFHGDQSLESMLGKDRYGLIPEVSDYKDQQETSMFSWLLYREIADVRGHDCTILIGRFGPFRPKGRRFESRSSHHVWTLGKSFTRNCLWPFGVKYIIRAVSGAPLSSSGLEEALLKYLQ